MATLRDIKRRISSVKSTQQITKAMKMVAAAKLRRAQERIEMMRPYVSGLTNVLANVSSRVEPGAHPYFREREVRRVCLVVVSADRGLCGSFNANILRRARGEIAQLRQAGHEVSLVTIGRKAYDFFRKRDYEISHYLINIFNELQFTHATSIAEFVSTRFISGGFDQVRLIFTEAITPARQRVIVEQVLPIQPVEMEAEEGYQFEYIFEPEPQKLLGALCPKSINIKFWAALLESYLAEQGARMIAMDAATDNAQEMIYNLTLYYNKVRQASITKEITEIVGGAEALK